MKARTITEARVRISDQKRKILENANERITELRSSGADPKIIELFKKLAPELPQDRVNRYIEVLRLLETSDDDILTTSLNMDHNERERNFGINLRWELPWLIAQALVRDLKNGINVDAPSKEDLRSSEVFKITRMYKIPENVIENFISDQDIPEKNQKAEKVEEPTLEEAVENLHPIARKQWEKSSKSYVVISAYEILSEVLKVYPTWEAWKQDSWPQRREKVPELRLYGPHCSLDFEDDLRIIYQREM